ncbi:hypothetical protein ACUXOQ_001443 [Dermabacter hominis]
MPLTAQTPLQIVPQALAAIDPASALARAESNRLLRVLCGGHCR